jgi:hypothetical protein
MGVSNFLCKHLPHCLEPCRDGEEGMARQQRLPLFLKSLWRMTK